MNIRMTDNTKQQFRKAKDRLGCKTDEAFLHLLLVQHKEEGQSGFKWLNEVALRESVQQEFKDTVKRMARQLEQCRASRDTSRSKLGALVRAIRHNVPPQYLKSIDFSKYDFAKPAQGDEFLQRLEEVRRADL